MTRGGNRDVFVGGIAGVLAVIAFVAGQSNDDAVLRALATGLLVLCLSSAMREVRRRRKSATSQR